MASRSPAALVVLGRAPVHGEVKQRLAAKVGPDSALAVYQWLLARTLAVCQGTGLPVWFFATDPDHQEVQKLARRHDCLLRQQTGGDLGERMAAALDQVHQASDQVVLLGTDCPVMTAADLWALVGVTSTRSLGLLAAEDGGYVALASGTPRLWRGGNPLAGVRWGTETALSDTVKSLRRYDEKVTICGTKWDLDTEADLARARHGGLCTL